MYDGEPPAAWIPAVEQLFTQLKVSLGQAAPGGMDLQRTEECFHICEKVLYALKDIYQQQIVCAKGGAVSFFKCCKPRFVSLRQYYFLLHKYYLFKPDDPHELVCYLQRNLEQLHKFSAEWNWFYDSCKPGCTCVDEMYFLPVKALDFTTKGESILSELFANQLFEAQLQKELENFYSS